MKVFIIPLERQKQNSSLSSKGLLKKKKTNILDKYKSLKNFIIFYPFMKNNYLRSSQTSLNATILENKSTESCHGERSRLRCLIVSTTTDPTQVSCYSFF